MYVLGKYPVVQLLDHRVTFFLIFFKILFIYSWEKEAETQAEGEAGSMQGNWCGTRSGVSRVTPWAKGAAKPLSHPGCPSICSLLIAVHLLVKGQESDLYPRLQSPPVSAFGALHFKAHNQASATRPKSPGQCHKEGCVAYMCWFSNHQLTFPPREQSQAQRIVTEGPKKGKCSHVWVPSGNSPRLKNKI